MEPQSMCRVLVMAASIYCRPLKQEEVIYTN